MRALVLLNRPKCREVTPAHRRPIGDVRVMSAASQFQGVMLSRSKRHQGQKETCPVAERPAGEPRFKRWIIRAQSRICAELSGWRATAGAVGGGVTETAVSSVDGSCPAGCATPGVPSSAIGFLVSFDFIAPLCSPPGVGAAIGMTSALPAGAPPINVGIALTNGGTRRPPTMDRTSPITRACSLGDLSMLR